MPVQDKEVVKRFLRYVKIDTQSKEDVDDFPSTKKQLDLAKVLARELEELGVKDVSIDEYGYVIGTLPSNLLKTLAAEIPTVGLIAHMDTSPEAPRHRCRRPRRPHGRALALPAPRLRVSRRGRR